MRPEEGRLKVRGRSLEVFTFQSDFIDLCICYRETADMKAPTEHHIFRPIKMSFWVNVSNYMLVLELYSGHSSCSSNVKTSKERTACSLYFPL